MKPPLLWTRLFLTLILLVGGWELAAKTKTENEVDKLFKQWNRPGSPGGAIVVVEEGKVTYQQGYGFASLEHPVPITPTTVFDVASVAKQFTGLAVAMLAGEGKLSPRDEVRQHLPEVPDFGRPITLEHLLHHTSGLRDWTEALDILGTDGNSPITLEMIMEMLRRQRELDFQPGSEYLYCNTSYNLLAEAVRKVSGRSFSSWSRERIFQPLGMNQTRVYDRPFVIVTNLALPYAPDGKGGFRQAVHTLAAPGSSSLLTTAEDLGRWLLNFDRPRVGSSADHALMQQRGKLNHGPAVSYGFGIGVSEPAGMKRLTHGGSWAGYRSHLLWIPEKRFGVAVVANVSNFNPGQHAQAIADLYLGRLKNSRSSTAARKNQESDRTFASADRDSWDGLTGTFRLGAGWLLTITREGNQLMTQANGEEKFPLVPQTRDRYLVPAYDGSSIEFVRSDTGSATNLIYRGIRAPRVYPPNLGSTRLADYAGDYWSEELQKNCRIELQENRLAMRTPGGQWSFLIPTGRDQFDTEHRRSLIFSRPKDGEVSELKISAARVRNLRFVRRPLPSK